MGLKVNGQQQLSSFADQVAAALGSHAGGMDRAGRNIAALTGAKGLRFAVHGEGHLSGQDDVRSFGLVSVIRVRRAGPVFPGIGATESFSL